MLNGLTHFVIALLLASAPPLEGFQKTRLSQAQVQQLVAIGAPDQVIAQEIQDRGLDFTPTQKMVEDLQHHGAGPQTLTAVRELVSGTPRAQTLTRSGCAGLVNPVVPSACLGEFRHGTLVKKTGSGASEVLELAHGPSDATLTHPGIDLVADCGSPVYALADGVVIDIIADKNDPDFAYLGYMVRLKHAATSTGRPLPATQMHQTETLYLHLQDPPTAQLGRLVSQRSRLGSVGRTGAAWGCHTHLEVRHFAGRYMSDKAWNSPPNIYGKGDQTGSKVFKENWTDPLSWLTTLPPQLAAPAEVILELSVKSTSRPSPQPTTTYTDIGACPGEGCRYSDAWTMEASTPVYPTRGATATSYALKPGEKVTTLTGTVITKPGKIRVIHPVRISGQQLVESGYVYVLTYRGEGFWKVWLNGKLTESVAIRNVVSPMACKPSDASCREKAESRWITGPVWGEMEEPPQPEWWVQIRDASSRVGWIKVTGPTWASINGEF